MREDHWIDLGECKWGGVSSVPELTAEVESRVMLYPNADNATLGRWVFTRRPLKAALKGKPVRFVSLEDLYALEA